MATWSTWPLPFVAYMRVQDGGAAALRESAGRMIGAAAAARPGGGRPRREEPDSPSRSTVWTIPSARPFVHAECIHVGKGTDRKEAMVDTHHSDAREEHELSSRGMVAVGVTAGLLGGVVLAAPILIWDWVRTGQRGLELPMAATAWLFGLDRFSHDENLWGSIVLGAILLAVYWALSGIAFTALAERVRPPLQTAWAIVAGAAWSFASFIFFWYMLFPIARDGAPFRAPRFDPLLYTAPNWVWILGFTLSALAIAGSYAALRGSPAFRREERRADRVDEPRTRLHPAA